jgi:hypothetical protein
VFGGFCVLPKIAALSLGLLALAITSGYTIYNLRPLLVSGTSPQLHRLLAKFRLSS